MQAVQNAMSVSHFIMPVRISDIFGPEKKSPFSIYFLLRNVGKLNIISVYHKLFSSFIAAVFRQVLKSFPLRT